VKVWERLKKCAKSWDSVLNADKVCSKLIKYEKCWYKLRKGAESWERVLKGEKVY
jgi:hypothetical protein